MLMASEPEEKVSAEQARQGRWGMHVLIILICSLILAGSSGLALNSTANISPTSRLLYISSKIKRHELVAAASQGRRGAAEEEIGLMP
jgi:hypothetical protein